MAIRLAGSGRREDQGIVLTPVLTLRPKNEKIGVFCSFRLSPQISGRNAGFPLIFKGKSGFGITSGNTTGLMENTPGRGSGPRGLGFKSPHSDQTIVPHRYDVVLFFHSAKRAGGDLNSDPQGPGGALRGPVQKLVHTIFFSLCEKKASKSPHSDQGKNACNP